MVRLLALGLLLTQLRPFVAAGICLHAAAESAGQCGPMQEAPLGSGRSHESIPSGCNLVAVCEPSAPTIIQPALHLERPSLPAYREYSSPSLLLQGDPIAPPHPPPIA
jgi:hypothetical protein